MSRQFLRRHNPVTDSRAPYKPQTNTKDMVHAAMKIITITITISHKIQNIWKWTTILWNVVLKTSWLFTKLIKKEIDLKTELSDRANLHQGVWPQPKVIRDLNPDFSINPDSDPDVYWIAPKNIVHSLSCRLQSFCRVSLKLAGDCVRNTYY